MGAAASVTQLVGGMAMLLLLFSNVNLLCSVLKPFNGFEISKLLN